MLILNRILYFIGPKTFHALCYLSYSQYFFCDLTFLPDIWLFVQIWDKFGQFEELQPPHLIYWRELSNNQHHHQQPQPRINTNTCTRHHHNHYLHRPPLETTITTNTTTTAEISSSVSTIYLNMFLSKQTHVNWYLSIQT